MLVYRIENAQRLGPYQHSVSWVYTDHMDLDHPQPCDDDIDCSAMTYSHVCGFDSLDKLKTWFTHEELTGLSTLGYSLSTYEVDSGHCLIGKRQVVFYYPLAKLVETVSIAQGHLEGRLAA